MRRTLPDRRPSATFAAEWGGHELLVTVGYYPDTLEVGDVFVDMLKDGQMAAMLDDAAVVISLAIQHGITPDALAKSLGRVPVWVNGVEAEGPASPVGVILEVVRGAI